MTTAFVLSGGASLGAVQVGMLQALVAHGVTPDLIVGTSAGALNGAFASITIPGNGGPVGDPLGRRYSLLIEGRAATGVGTVDAIKIGFARGGDLDFDGDVDFDDAFTLTNNYGTPAGANWRMGDSNNDGAVDFADAFEQVNNYGFTYVTQPGSQGDPKMSLVYNWSTGYCSIEAPLGDIIKSIDLKSEDPGQFLTNAANWLPANGADATFTVNAAGQQGFATNTALGNTFLVQNGYGIGMILPAGLSESFLLQNLTIRYGVQGQIGTFDGDLIYVPEPSAVLLLIAGLAVLGLKFRLRSKAR